MKKELYGIEEIAKYLDMSVPFIRKLVQSNNIPYFRVGWKVKFDLNEINKWLEERKQDVQ